MGLEELSGFVVEFVPPEDDQAREMVPTHRSRLRSGALTVNVIGNMEDSRGNRRPVLIENPVFPHPGKGGDQVIVGCPENYVVVASGARKGLIIYRRFLEEEEESRPVSVVHWLDEDEERRAHASELVEMSEGFEPKRFVEWPDFYFKYDSRLRPMGVRDSAVTVLNKIPTPTIPPALRQRVQEEAIQVYGALAHFVQSWDDPAPHDLMVQKLWSKIRHVAKSLLVPVDLAKVPKTAPLFADMSSVPLVQRISRGSGDPYRPLSGHAGRVRYGLK